MVQGDPAFDLTEYLKSVFRSHHDAFLIELLGAPGSGFNEDTIETLLEGKVLRIEDLPGMTVPGSKHAVDPFGFAMYVAASMNDAEPEERRQMTAWPLDRWVSHVDERMDAVIEEATEARPLEEVSEQGEPVEGPEMFPTQPKTPSSPNVHKIPPKLPSKPTPPLSQVAAPMIEAPPAHIDRHFKEAWIEARTRAGEYVRGLGTKVDADARVIAEEVWSGEDISVEADRDKRLERREDVRQLTAEAVAEGWDARKLAQELAKRSKDYARDWDRIARTELQGAYNDGVVLDGYRVWGDDLTIARVPEDGACPDCLRLLLDNEGNPRVFSVQELQGNGTNVGRRRAGWLPTSWPLHPNCRCDTVVVPLGLKIRADGRLEPIDS